MSIEQLSKATLQQAIFLRDEIFEALSKLDKKTLAASLDPDNFQKFYIQSGIEKLDYWVYITDKNEVVGIVGLYSEYTNQAAWLGWYGVHPLQRGQKIGSKLLDFAIDLAKQRGYKELHLYTTKEHNEAIILYEKRGFVKYKKNKELKTLYYKKELHAK